MNPFNTVMRSQVFIVSMWRLKTLLDMTKLHFTSRSQVGKIFRNNLEISEFKGCCIKFWNIMISIIYNTVRLKCFYWIITQNQAHVKSAHRKVGCYQILMEVVHIYHTICAVLYQDRLNTFFFFFCTTLNLSFFLFWSHFLSSSSSRCPSGGGPNCWQKSRSKSHSYSAAHCGKPYRVLLVDWR